MINLDDVIISLDPEPTVKIRLPEDYKKAKFLIESQQRTVRERSPSENQEWVEAQKNNIKNMLSGSGAAQKEGANLIPLDPGGKNYYPMRSPGAGILPRIKLDDKKYIILHIRGTNRGAIWPAHTTLAHMFCWKEFAGVIDTVEGIEDPRTAAVKELYEELSLITAGNKLTLPSNIFDYQDVYKTLTVALARANKHFGFNLSFSYSNYKEAKPIVPQVSGSQPTTVSIHDHQWREISLFDAIVNYDPLTNALEISFIADLEIDSSLPLTGFMSIAGEENNNETSMPYMEDIVLVEEDILQQTEPGNEVDAFLLLSVHGPQNYEIAKIRKGNRAFYLPAPTLKPIVSYLKGEYSFRNILEEALKSL